MAGTLFDRMLLRDIVDNLQILLPPAEHDLDLGLGTELPIALLPVRLEARFEESAGPTPWLLKVRIIPDDIHVPTLSEGVTAQEVALADEFRASPHPGDADSWRRLATGFGAGLPRTLRAAWVADQAVDGAVAERPAPPLTVRALPSKWYVSAWSEGALITSAESSPVAAALHIDPSGAAGDVAWLTDFQAAIDAGMGVELHVPSPSVDVLLAVGVHDGDGAAELAAVLDAQSFSRGVDLLPPGTPTNNTPAVKAAWRSDPDMDEIRRRMFEPPVGATDGTNGRTLTAALGLPAGNRALSRPAAAGRADQADARAMLDLLWPVTGGELLAVMLTDRSVNGKGGVSQRVHEFLRDHASRFVRGRGPLPTVLVGRQPYGVLPVGSLSKWVTGGDSFLDALRGRLLTGWAVWEDAVQALPRLGGHMDAGTATKLIATLLAQSPVPDATGYHGTTIDPPLFSRTMPTLPIDGPLDGDLTAGLLQVSWIPLLSDCKEDPSRVGAVVLPAVAPGGGARLASLPTGDGPIWLQVVHAEHAKEDLLSQLAQHALVRSAERAASYISEVAAGVLQHPEFELMASTTLVQDLGVTGPASPLDVQLTSVGFAQNFAGTSFGDLLREPSKFDTLGIALPKQSPEHRAAVAAVDHLSALDDASLELLMAETLDVFANRYDAWVTSLATRRLGDLRAQHGEGVHLGGFGWLVDVTAQPATSPGSGYVHAPSPAHAATAAVLRHADIDDRAASLDPSGDARRFDVTAASVRRARGILDAVRHGQPLSAVLGYHVERFLQGTEPTLIDTLRHDYGSVGGEAPDTTIVDLAVPAHDVVDGVAVWRALMITHTLTHPALEAELSFTVDALSDLLVAEGVHQLVRGDHTRAGATVAALSRGLPPPADLHVVDTPGRHLALPVQLLLAADHTAVADQHGWAADRARAAVAPAAERLARALLPDPATVGIRLRHADAAEQETVVTLADLHLCALDVLAEAGDDDDRAALAARVRLHARTAGTLLPEPADGHAAGWGALTALARAWARVFAAARPLLHGDVEIGPAEGAPPPPPPADTAVAAAEAALTAEVARLGDAADAIDAAVAALAGGAPDAGFLHDLDTQLAVFGRAGIAGSAQEPGDDPLATARRCVAAARRAQQRLAQMHTAVDEDHTLLAQRPRSAGELSERTDKCAAAARDIFGAAVVVVPAIDAPAVATASADVAPGLPSSDDLLDWLGELSEVRGGTRRWWRAMLASEAGTGRTPTLLPAQFPVSPGEGWVGGWAGATPATPWTPPLSARRAFVTCTPEPLTGPGLAALVVESWVEQVPVGLEVELDHADSVAVPEGRHVEPTGVAVHYNAAGARPPQSILLAVPPDPTRAHWQLGDLVATLLETIELSRFRSVEPPQDLPSRMVLPAIFVPEGIEGLSFVSTLLETIGAGVLVVEAEHWRRFGDA